MRISEQTRVLAACLAFVTLTGCAAATAPSRKPLAPIPTGAGPTVRRVLDVLAARDLALARFRAQTRLDFRSPERSFRSTQVIVVGAPASARIDVINPFGVSYTVATDGKLLSAYDRRQSVFYSGTAQEASFRRFIGIALGAEEIAAVLRGLPPALDQTRWSAVAGVEGGWLMRRRLAGGGVLELVVEATSLVPVRVKISGDRNRREVQVLFSDYRDVAGLTVAHRIEVSFKDGTHLDIAYKSVQREVPIPLDGFRMDKPAGARLVNIDGGGGGV